MSHRSGEHGLSVHNTMEELKDELRSVVEAIHNNGVEFTQDQKTEDTDKVDEVCDGYWAELSDTTWFDVFKREVLFGPEFYS